MEEQAVPWFIQQIEANLLGAYEHLGLALGAEFQRSPSLTSFFTGQPLPICNGVVQAQLPVQQADIAIQNVMHESRARGVPITWLLGPSSEPADLETRLIAQGWTLDEVVPGMAIELEHCREIARVRSVSGLTVTQVQDASMMEIWLDVFCTGFGLPDPVRAIFFGLYQKHGFVPSATSQYFLGLLDGKPVGTALLTVERDVVGIYAIATLPDCRRRGIGFAMTLAAMQAAYEAGYKLGTLQATPMGLPVYRRMGWHAYCTFKTYTFAP